MSFKSAEQFVSEMKDADDLRKLISNIKSSKEFWNLIQSHGFEFSDYDLAKAMSSCMNEMKKNACSEDEQSCGQGKQIDQNTKTLIAISAAIAANCIPCIEHYLFIAESFEINKDAIQEAIDIGSKVKTGASIAIKDAIENIIQGKTEPKEADCCKSASSCC